MKTGKTLWMLIAVIILTSGMASAQKKKKEAAEPSDADRFNWGQSKQIPKLKKLAITELTVNYKLTTTAKTIVQEKRSRHIAGARVSAYLEITDGELTDNDYQVITDHFYRYFQKKLKQNGIDTMGWNDVTASNFYQKIGGDDDEEKDDSKKSGGGNEWVVSTANKGKIVHSGQAGFAGGKGKRSMTFADECDCTAASFKVNVDFAQVLVDLELKTSARKDIGGGWYYPESTSKKYSWGVHPQMQVGDQDNRQLTYIWGKKGWPEFLYQWTDVPGKVAYAESVTEDMSKARSGLAKGFAFRKELTPVLIQTTREKYIAAAKQAVEQWSDAFVARAVQMKK